MAKAKEEKERTKWLDFCRQRIFFLFLFLVSICFYISIPNQNREKWRRSGSLIVKCAAQEEKFMSCLIFLLVFFLFAFSALEQHIFLLSDLYLPVLIF